MFFFSLLLSKNSSIYDMGTWGYKQVLSLMVTCTCFVLFHYFFHLSLLSSYKDSKNGLVNGIAFVDTICTSSSVGIVRYEDYVTAISTISHELGHSLVLLVIIIAVINILLLLY